MTAGLSWITLLAFAMSVGFCLFFRGLAREWYLVDIPDARKKHEGSVPLCGGIAIFLSFAVAACFALGAPGHDNAVALLPGLAVILAVGVMDDRFNLPVMPRLAIQLLAALLIIGLSGIHHLYLGLASGLPDAATQLPETMSGALTETLAETWAETIREPLFLLLSLAFVVGLVNAVNMSDGVDGLAGSSSAAAFFWLAVIGFGVGEHRLGIQSLALSAACLGFLVFNMRHRWRGTASLFLGDGGSTLLGAALAGIVLNLASGADAIAFPVLLWVVIVPVIDTLSLIVRRLAQRRSPFSPDRQHLHHLLMDAGLNCGQTAVLVMAFNFIAGAIAWAAVRFGLPTWAMLSALLVPAAAHMLFVYRMTRGARPVATAPKADTAQAGKPKITLPGATS
ncbi:UDP-GlcNAc:undecaprenyl-phosphate GlcNAc-1-phosphate transferase [Ochrobactrum daejeonense]|uniref:UDP-GlcNAc:undecaprenyl-phosphate GlcNAc-1-phosphate transferase n=1 Tax=Brucella daejeonensis TaxID=659015 RepID=A0A7W9AYA9_9HYPH|nr:MraY family glycosyltransferase [Brucella daejeonensis]MBB5702845.1 UDP-GlcNAc:undecaprenyl-phosphate GlcNAc-1-phosphate transferase [Brucella daejeonensis]